MKSRSNVHLVMNQRDLTGGQYNACTFNAKGQNIIQGDIKDVTVSEVNFPYDIPNVQGPTSSFVAESNLQEPVVVVVPSGFYTGRELAGAINIAFAAAAALAATPIPPTDVPTFTYDETSNRFKITPPATPVDRSNDRWIFNSNYTFPGQNVTINTLGKDIFSLMGYLTSQGTQLSNNGFSSLLVTSRAGDLAPAGPVLGAASAPLVFTQYIDICSPQLCKFQYFRDGSTTNLARRSDVICRLFICNNIALAQADPEGTRPFVINRQFYNARVMRWTADNSVGTIDINLYDDVGQPLTTAWQPRPYQITFNAMENPKDEGMDLHGSMMTANMHR